jgi:hypothetical protein
MITFFEFVLVLGPTLDSDLRKQTGYETFERQCRRYLPLRVEKIWIRNDQELDETSLERVKDELRKPQGESPHKVDLSTEFELFQKVTQGYDWEDMCRAAEQSAKKLVSERVEVIQYADQGAQKVKEDRMRTNAQLGARKTFLGEKVDIDEENERFGKILAAVSETEMRVDSCSVVFFGPKSWL